MFISNLKLKIFGGGECKIVLKSNQGEINNGSKSRLKDTNYSGQNVYKAVRVEGQHPFHKYTQGQQLKKMY